LEHGSYAIASQLPMQPPTIEEWITPPLHYSFAFAIDRLLVLCWLALWYSYAIASQLPSHPPLKGGLPPPRIIQLPLRLLMLC
jgi:hypothetical protein